MSHHVSFRASRVQVLSRMVKTVINVCLEIFPRWSCLRSGIRLCMIFSAEWGQAITSFHVRRKNRYVVRFYLAITLAKTNEQFNPLISFSYICLVIGAQRAIFMPELSYRLFAFAFTVTGRNSNQKLLYLMKSIVVRNHGTS